MTMNNIDLANYNQTTISCKYCPSAVKRSKMPYHVAKCHKDELIKERESERKPKVEDQFPDTPSLVPERPICHIVPNDDTENWNDSKYTTYNPLVATAEKKVIRGTYYIGRSSQEKQKCREFETARMAYLMERNPETFESSYQPEVFEAVPESNIDNGNSSDCSEESWSEYSIAVSSTPSELDEDSFKTCNSGDTNNSTGENLSSFETTMAEYLRNLSEEKRAEVVRKFSKIMREH